jgi:hypothetical protein
MEESPKIPVITGAAVTELDRFWLEIMRGFFKDAIDSIEGAARQLISVLTLLEGIYFAAISFSDIRTAMSGGYESAGLTLLFILPVVLWLVSLSYAVAVFTPEAYQTNISSPDLSRKTYHEIVAYKHRMLKRSHLALIIGFIPLIIAIVAYLQLPKG